MFLYNLEIKIIGGPIGSRGKPVVDGDLDNVCWENKPNEGPCPPNAIRSRPKPLRSANMMRPDGRVDRAAPSILSRGRRDSRGGMEDAITPQEAMVLGVRFMLDRNGNVLGPDRASALLETPWPEIRRREALAMRKLRQAGYSDREISDYFQNEWDGRDGLRR